MYFYIKLCRTWEEWGLDSWEQNFPDEQLNNINLWKKVLFFFGDSEANTSDKFADIYLNATYQVSLFNIVECII